MNNNATPPGTETDETAFHNTDDDSDADNLNTTQHNGTISTDQQQQDDAKRQLPEGWERVQSKSRPGEISYKNKLTGDKQCWFPEGPARRASVDEEAAINAGLQKVAWLVKANTKVNFTEDDAKLPRGWQRVESRSQPGTFVYENTTTGERQAWMPDTHKKSEDHSKEKLHTFENGKWVVTKKADETTEMMIPREGVVIIPCLSQLRVHSIGEENGNQNKVSQNGILFLNATLILHVGGNMHPTPFATCQKRLEQKYGAIDEELFEGLFHFRINGVATTKEIMEQKKLVRIPGFGYKVIYSLKLPLKISCIFGVAPFEVSEASVKIEMSKSVMRDTVDGSIRVVRPDLLVNPDDERDFVLIPNPDEMDESPMYSLLTRSPFVEMFYDRRRGSCAKYSMKFYIERPTVSWVDPNTLMPLILIAALTTLNVMMGDEAGPDLENTIAIALTAVFVLPALVEGEDDKIHVGFKVLWKTGPVYLLFVGMILAAFCHDPLFYAFGQSIGEAGGDELDFGSGTAPISKDADNYTGFTVRQKISIVNWVGVCLVWLSIFPLVANIVRYLKLKKALGMSATVKSTLKEKGSKRKAFRSVPTSDEEENATNTGCCSRGAVKTSTTAGYKQWAIAKVVDEDGQQDITDALNKMIPVLQYATGINCSNANEVDETSESWGDDFTKTHPKISTTPEGKLEDRKGAPWKVRHKKAQSVSIYLGPIPKLWQDGYHGPE